MFGLSEREKVVDILRRGAMAAMSRDYFHPSEADKLGLNEEAAACLLTEAIAHQLYILCRIYDAAFLGKKMWATPKLFFSAISEGIAASEMHLCLIIGSTLPIVLKTFNQLGSLTPEQMNPEEFYAYSISLVKKHDPSADENALRSALVNANESYLTAMKNVFQSRLG